MKTKSYLLCLALLFSIIIYPTNNVTALDDSSAVTGTTATETAVSFTDLGNDTYTAEAISALATAGYVHGYPDGLFHPDNTITRAEFIVITNQIFHFQDAAPTVSWPDVKPGDWYYAHLAIAAQAGYIAGYPDGKFHPKDTITREQVCVILDRLANITALPLDEEINDEVSSWALPSVQKVVSNYIWDLEAGNTFRAKDAATRGEVCLALAPFIYIEDPTVAEDGTTGTEGAIGGETEVDVDATIDKVVDKLQNKVLPEMTTAAQREIINDIIASLKSYKADKSFDYESVAEETYEKYKALPEADRKYLKKQVTLYVPTLDLLTLEDFFDLSVDE